MQRSGCPLWQPCSSGERTPGRSMQEKRATSLLSTYSATGGLAARPGSCRRIAGRGARTSKADCGRPCGTMRMSAPDRCPTRRSDAVNALTTQRVRPPRPPARQGRPDADRRRRAALRGHRGEPRAVDRRPVRPPRRRAQGARRHRPGGDGPGHGDPPADRSPARPASLRSGPMPRTHRRRRRPRARVRRTTRPHGQRGSPAAARLALPRGRAVLRSDPRQPDGSGEPPQVSLDPRPDQRLLGRGVHLGRVRRARRARRPVRLHRQPGRQPVGPDARRARHHPGRPGRHHPRGIPRRSRRRRRSGYGEDRRRSAPLRLPALLRPSPRVTAGAACCSSARTSPTWPTSPTSCPASARRACRPAPCGTSSPREPRRRSRPTRTWPA